MKKLPQQVFVHLQSPDDRDECLITEATVEAIAEKGEVRHVGLYVLKETFHVGLRPEVRGTKLIK